MDRNRLWLYAWLSRLDGLQSYKGKIMVVAFLGTNVPLLTLIFYFVLSNAFSLGVSLRILGIALLATLGGTALMLYSLHNLLAPVTLTAAALQDYLNQHKLPNLPTEFRDEAGGLMANTTRTIHKTDELIQQLAHYDDLTGLPNRSLLRDRLQQELVRAEAEGQWLAVNLSARQFEQPNLRQTIAQILQETGLDPAYLELEVTESLLMKNVQQSEATLQQLHAMGISLALDDFGTGYSSLSYLQRFPVDTLKIDQSFVRELPADPDDTAVVNAIIALAQSLQMTITAEGVEPQAQLEYLQA